MITRWVGQHFDTLRLTDTERKEWTKQIEQLRDEGNEALDRFVNSEHGDYYKKKYKDWKSCPTCDENSTIS